MAENPRLGVVLAAQALKAAKAESAEDTSAGPKLLVAVDPADATVWHFLAAGFAGPLASGEFIFRLDAPKDFPHKPPKFQFITPTGIFTPGGAICISIGEFHSDNAPGKDGGMGWRPALGMMGFAAQVVNALITFDSKDHGINIKVESPDVQADCARKSRSANIRAAKKSEVLAHALAVFEEKIAAAVPGTAAAAIAAARANPPWVLRGTPELAKPHAGDDLTRDLAEGTVDD